CARGGPYYSNYAMDYW
nr:immunoglobulin heavy chain junction region [Mus musculus]